MSTERNKPLFEIYISAFLIVLLAGIPSVEIIIRKLLGTGLKGGYEYTRHIVLWLTLLGASVNSFTDRHMKIEFCSKFLPERGKKFAEALSEVANVEKQPKLEGRSMQMFLAPKPTK